MDEIVPMQNMTSRITLDVFANLKRSKIDINGNPGRTCKMVLMSLLGLVCKKAVFAEVGNV